MNGCYPLRKSISLTEAHGLEATATAVFETSVTDYTVEQLLSRTLFTEYFDSDELDERRFQNTLAFQESGPSQPRQRLSH